MILVNQKEVWPPRLISGSKEQLHKLRVTVDKATPICFVVKKNGENPGEKVIWDPVITYSDIPQKTK